jgi:hypothetical protein
VEPGRAVYERSHGQRLPGTCVGGRIGDGLGGQRRRSSQLTADTHSSARLCSASRASSHGQTELQASSLAGHEAVTVISTLSSGRAYGKLRTLADIAKPHSHRSDVAELRDRIRGALAMSA